MTPKLNCRVEHTDFPSPQESQNEQDNAHCVFDIRGLVHYEFVPHGVTAKVKIYVEVLKRLKRKVISHPADNWKLHHNNVLAHTAFLLTHFMADSKVRTLLQPP